MLLRALRRCAVAVRPTILSFVSDADFRDFGKEHPQVYEALVALLATRLRETDTTIAAVEDKAQLQNEAAL